MSPVGVRARLEVAIETKSFVAKSGERREALGPLAFALGDGEIAAIVGPSGCGKTTLMRLVAGLDRDFRGRIDRRADRLGVVFQEPRLLPWRSVEANVRIAAPQATDAELDDLFRRFGLLEHRAHYPGELSTGLARRVAFVRALAVKPDLLLLDEPFASLDPAMRQGLVRTVAQLLEASAITTLMITHDMDAAIGLADSIFLLSAGPATIVKRISIASPRARLSAAAAAAIAADVGAPS